MPLKHLIINNYNHGSNNVSYYHKLRQRPDTVNVLPVWYCCVALVVTSTPTIKCE